MCLASGLEPGDGYRLELDIESEKHKAVILSRTTQWYTRIHEVEVLSEHAKLNLVYAS